MGFSVFVELLNLRLRQPKRDPVHLHQPYAPEVGTSPAAEVE
jgi:hypothetical protein